MAVSMNHPVRFTITVLLAAFAFAMTGLALIAGFYTEKNAKVQTYVQFVDEFYLYSGKLETDEELLSYEQFMTAAETLSLPYVAFTYADIDYPELDWDDETIAYYRQKNRVHLERNPESVASISSDYRERLEIIAGKSPLSPLAKNEILIPSCNAYFFIYCGLAENFESLIGQSILFSLNDIEQSLTIVGIYNNKDCEEYQKYQRGEFIYSNSDTCRSQDKCYTGTFFICDELFGELSTDVGVMYASFAGDHAASTGSRVRDFFDENADTYQTNMFSGIELYRKEIAGMKTTFAIAAAVLSVFSILLLYQFITLSIDDKKQMIGILRALGGRSADVVKIFLIESGFVGALSGIFAVGVTAGLIPSANLVVSTLFSEHMAIMTFNPLAFVIVFALSLGVALLSSLIPVLLEARRLPVDVIKFNTN